METENRRRRLPREKLAFDSKGDLLLHDGLRHPGLVVADATGDGEAVDCAGEGLHQGSALQELSTLGWRTVRPAQRGLKMKVAHAIAIFQSF